MFDVATPSPLSQEDFRLDAHSPLPLYAQIEMHLLKLIHQQSFEPGQMLPSENELSRAYQVSRLTIRQALGDLVHQGILTRRHGKGTFINQPRMPQSLTQLSSFTEGMAAKGKLATSRVLRLESVEAPVTVAQKLQLSSPATVVLIERLRQADGTPMAVEQAYLSFRGCESLLSEDLTQSLYELLRARYNIVPTYAEQQIEAGVVSRTHRGLLKLAAGAPVLEIRRLTFAQNRTPFEYVEATYRGDKFTLYAQLDLHQPSRLSWNSTGH